MKLLGFFSLIILIPFCSFGHDISGQIADEYQQGILGTRITLLPTKYHTHTNEFGFFLVNDVKK
ncbi:MAG: hypothetical protein AB8H03_08890 [Saprospiraceae bacterium]